MASLTSSETTLDPALSEFLKHFGLNESDELTKTLQKEGVESISQLPDAIASLRENGSLSEEDLRQLRDFGRDLQTACQSDGEAKLARKESRSSHSDRRRGRDESFARELHGTWLTRLIRTVNRVPQVILGSMLQLVSPPKGRNAAYGWTLRFALLILIGLGGVLLFWDGKPSQRSQSQRVANAGDANLDAQVEPLDLSGVATQLASKDFAAAEQALGSVQPNSDSQSAEIDLLRTSLLLVQGKAVPVEAMKTLLEVPRFDSLNWRNTYAIWLMQSDPKSRQTVLDFLSATEEGNSWTRFRLKSWLKARHGDPGYSLRYLNQVEDLDAEATDLLFRASASIMKEDFRAARFDLLALDSLLTITEDETGSGVATTELVSATICNPELQRIAQRLLQRVPQKSAETP